jgi:hypothetical protein
VQAEQRELLSYLIAKFRLQGVYLEGLTADTLPAYHEKGAVLKAMGTTKIPELLKKLASRMPHRTWVRGRGHRRCEHRPNPLKALLTG